MTERRRKTNELKAKLQKRWPDHKFRVTRGTGTARHWITVKTTAPEEEYRKIKSVAAPYAGSYLPDCVPGQDKWTPCVHVGAL